LAREAPGINIDTVDIEIDYAILQHFSKHLYSSPNKAIEELVTNGYDALARHVDIFLPGSAADGCLIVWDDGDSMDLDGLKRLWWIARSPKENVPNRIAVSRDGQTRRLMIGKFGIGKLASYAVGNLISHVCRQDGRFLLVTVDYTLAPHLDDAVSGAEPAETIRKLSAPVVELEESAAKEFVAKLFGREPSAFEQLWARPSWTVAIIDELRPDVSITEGRLAWVLSMGMPLRPDFAVRVNDRPVTPRVMKDAEVTWDPSDGELSSALRRTWDDAVRQGQVAGEMAIGGKAMTLPQLGEVTLIVQIFAHSLLHSSRDEEGRSHGFFVMVRDRLLNPDDALLYLKQSSFETLYRMRAVICADGLDVDLLADRERLQVSTPRTAELAVLQRGVYAAARAFVERRDEETARRMASSPMPTESRELYRQPLSAAAMRHPDEDGATLDATSAMVERADATPAEPLTVFRPAENKLVVNTGHPLFAAVKAKMGGGRKAEEALRLVEMIAMSDVLLEGHLVDLGLEDALIADIVLWRDTQLRTAAVRYSAAPQELVEELRASSYAGAARFEKAIERIFQSMGFRAERDGRSGKKDILVVAPIGAKAFTFTLEGKGSKHAIENDAAEISGASAHAREAGAAFAVVVAREFKGFRAGATDPMVLKECREQATPVSIVDVETLVALLEALQANHYPLPSLIEMLQEVEAPAVKLDRVRNFVNPLVHFDYRGLLDEIWNLQLDAAAGDQVAILQLRQSRPYWKNMPHPDFYNLIIAVQAMSGGLLEIYENVHAVNLLQHPAVVADFIAANLGAR
jgi:hypothetical protein